jgi:hypothetical protein
VADRLYRSIGARPFTLAHVPGVGMVVINKGDTGRLPAAVGDQLVDRGRLERADGNSAETSTPTRQSRAGRRSARRSTAGRARSSRAAEASATKDSAPPSAAADDLTAARAAYKALVGKNPSPRLDAAAVAAKTAELSADPAKLAAAKAGTTARRPSRKSTTVSSDAPVD